MSAARKLDCALAYARVLPGRLLPVVPNGKKPAIHGWNSEASNDPVLLNQWFGNDRSNVGWTPGSGYFVLDIDIKPNAQGRNGFGTLAGLESRHCALPKTLSAITPTGGRHFWFKLPAGKVARTFSGSMLKPEVPGIDVRASGTGQVVLAPSCRDEGLYSWDSWNPLEDPPPPIAEAPAWLVAFACREEAQKPPAKKKDGAMTVAEGGRNAALVREAGRLRRVGYELEAMIASLQALNESQFSPPVPESEVEAVARWACENHAPTDGATLADQQDGEAWRTEIDNAEGIGEMLDVVRRLHLDNGLTHTEIATLTKAAAKQLNVPVKTLLADLKDDDQGDDRPVIQVKRHDFAGTVDACMQVLPAIPSLRQRSGELVEVVTDTAGSKLVVVQIPRLAYLTSRVAVWRYGEDAGGPDASVLQALHGAGAWPGVPEITGLLHHPSIDLNTGDVISGRGYVPSLRREAVFDPARFPTYDGDDAFKLLQGLLSGFPFPTAHDEAAAIAAILTAAIRPVLPTAPAFFVSACDFGSGKSYLSKLIAAFAGGAGVQRWPGRAEEQGKALLALLMEGRPAVIFDNMSSDWRSDTLAAILTDSVHSDRILGVSSNATVSTACLWIGNGVNVGPVADLQRRVITITLDARVEKPWERTFDRDPVADVEADRGRWLMIALKVLSDFIKGGEAPEFSSLGGFADWTRVIRGAVVANGLADPVEALGANVADDEERDLLARVLWFWFNAFPGEPMTSRDLIRAVSNASGETNEAGLRYALEEIAEERGEISRRRLGYWLRAHKGRIVDRLRLVSAESKGEFGAAWHVQQV